MKVFTVIGIITNCSIAFLESEFVKDLNYKWTILFIVENIIVLMFFLVNYDSLPNWYKYSDIIKLNYINNIMKSEYERGDNKLDRSANLNNSQMI